jgi:hypothetical protein
MIFFAWKVVLGKPFGFGNTLVSNFKIAEKVVSDHPLVGFNFISSSVIHNTV